MQTLFSEFYGTQEKRDLLEKQEILYQKVFTGTNVNWFSRDGKELNGNVSSLILLSLLS